VNQSDKTFFYFFSLFFCIIVILLGTVHIFDQKKQNDLTCKKYLGKECSYDGSNRLCDCDGRLINPNPLIAKEQITHEEWQRLLAKHSVTSND
jgi:hypothetical protein